MNFLICALNMGESEFAIFIAELVLIGGFAAGLAFLIYRICREKQEYKQKVKEDAYKRAERKEAAIQSSDEDAATVAQPEIMSAQAAPNTPAPIDVAPNAPVFHTPSLDEAFKNASPVEEEDDDKSKDSEDNGKITFFNKMETTSVQNKAVYNAVKNELLSFKGVHSRTVNGGDYFRKPGKPLAKIILIGKTMRLALALDADRYEYSIYHQKNRSNMKKYADTPMFVKVCSRLGVSRAQKLIADMMAQNGCSKISDYIPLDYAYMLSEEQPEENEESNEQ